MLYTYLTCYIIMIMIYLTCYCIIILLAMISKYEIKSQLIVSKWYNGLHKTYLYISLKKATNITYTNKPINVHFCPYMYNREHQGTKAIPNSLHSWKLKKGEPLKMYFLKTFLFVGFQNHQWHEFITTVLHVLDRNDFKMKIAVFCLQITYSIFTLQQNLTASWQTVDYFH